MYKKMKIYVSDLRYAIITLIACFIALIALRTWRYENIERRAKEEAKKEMHEFLEIKQERKAEIESKKQIEIIRDTIYILKESNNE